MGAQGHPDSDLVGALSDGVTHHAIQTDDRQHQRNGREDRQQRRVEARRGDRCTDVLLHSLNAEEGQFLIHRSQLARDTAGQRPRIA